MSLRNCQKTQAKYDALAVNTSQLKNTKLIN